jgi:acetyl esterase/lipase
MSRFERAITQKSSVEKAGRRAGAKVAGMQTSTISETDVLFASRPGGDLTATLYRPAGPVAAAVVDVHGGAWTMGTRAMNAAIARFLAGRGIAVLALDFRMPPAAGYPETVTDVTAGIRWLKAHAAEIGTDVRGVGLFGASSGGHLALLAALRPFDPRYAGTPEPGEPDGTVPFLALCWPVSDPLARFRMARETGLERLVEAHHAFWPSEAAMEEGSPFHIVSRGDAQRLPELCVIVGAEDENLTPDMQPRLCDAYRARGGVAELTTYPGEMHSFIGKDPASDASRDALERIATFVLRQAAR